MITVAVKVSCHCGVIIVFNVKYMTLESINDSVFYNKLIFSITEPIFVGKTSFCLISVKASSGLRKMFSQCCYNQNVWENVCPTILDTHFHWFMILILNCGKVQLLPHVYNLECLIELAQLRLLADVIANIVDDVVPTYIMLWQMLLPYYPL